MTELVLWQKSERVQRYTLAVVPPMPPPYAHIIEKRGLLNGKSLPISGSNASQNARHAIAHAIAVHKLASFLTSR